MTAEEEAVRRALASTPAEGPMPPSVAARLDATLAELVAHRPVGEGAEDEPAAATVVALAERRRRRWPRVLVAAASVSVLAYGVGAVVTGQDGVGGAADSLTTSQQADAGAGQAEGGATAPEAAGEPEAEPARPPSEGPVAGLTPPGAADQLLTDRRVLLSGEALRRDVARLLRVTETASQDRDGRRSAGQALRGCEVPAVGDGDALAAVLLDGRPATLVVRARSAGTRVVEVYSCDRPSDLLALTRLPARR